MEAKSLSEEPKKANPQVKELSHRNFRDDEFWKEIPAWS